MKHEAHRPVLHRHQGAYRPLRVPAPQPRDGRPFYVGKGTGDRVFNHLASARRGADGSKKDRIREIYEAGLEPKLILRHGLDDASAFHVEAAALHMVELMGGALTNLVQGHGVAFGRMTAEELEARYNRQPAQIDSPPY